MSAALGGGGRPALAGLLLGAAACGGNASEPGPLVEASAWSALAADADPLAAHRPPEVRCAAAGWGLEDGTLEVDTGACNYLAVAQPLLRDVPEGVPVEVELWHQALHAEGPAEAHAALLAGGTLVWERRVPIPNLGAVWRDLAPAPRDLRAGEPVVFHLHNHGANNWRLGQVRSTR